MKTIVIFAVLICNAYAKLNVFLNDEKFEHSNLHKLVSKHVTNDPDHQLFSNDIQRNIVDDKIIAFLEEAREKFGEGFNESGIPPLDPFTIDNVNIELKQKPIIDAILNIPNISVIGLQDFVIENIHFRIIGLSLEYEFIVPELVYTSEFDLNGKAAMVIPLNASGNIRLDAKRLHINGNATLGTTSSGYLLLKTFFVDFDIEETEVYISSLIGIQQIDNVLNWILNQLSDDFFQGQRDILNEYASGILFDILGEAVGNISLADLIG
ncbi:uncharacterized protein LOC143912965 [Arctopsyche grandis]|uniref:uncharacterized protein LOC143912964 n=1 Tax=Arctopsyche grandis TaxID=121162 RepID=UPI00406DA452